MKDGTLQGNPNKQLKAIIAKENKIKDPFRIKKAVTFMINLTQSESDDDEDEEETNQDQSAGNGSEEKKAAANGGAEANQPVKK